MKTFLQCSECGHFFENNFSERQTCCKCGTEIISNIQNMKELKSRFIRRFKKINLFAVGLFIAITLTVYFANLIYLNLQTKLYKSTATIKMSIIDYPNIESDKIAQIYYANIVDLIKSKEFMLEIIDHLNLADKNANEVENIYNKLIQRIEISHGIAKNEYDNILFLSVFITLISSEPQKATAVVNEIISLFEEKNDELRDLIDEKVKLTYSSKIIYYTDKINFLKSEIEKTQEEKQDDFIKKINLETLGNEYKSGLETLKKFEFEIIQSENLETEFDFIEARIPTKCFYPNIRQSALGGLVAGIFIGLLLTYYIIRI